MVFLCVCQIYTDAMVDVHVSLTVKLKPELFIINACFLTGFLNSQLCVMSKREDILNMVISGSQKPHPTTDQGFCL